MRLITDNLALKSIITSSSVDVHFPLDNLRNVLRSKRMRTTDTIDQWVKFDLSDDMGEGDPVLVDSMVLLLPKEGNLTFTSLATVKLQASNTDDWIMPEVDVTLDITDLLKYRQTTHYFSISQSFRYWRLVMTDASTPSTFFEISKVILGLSEQMDPAQNGFQWSNTDTSKVQRNDFGTPYVDIFPKLKTLKLNYNTLTYNEAIHLEDIFERVGVSTPIWVVIDPFELVFDKDRYSIYGNLGSSFNSDHINYKLFDSSGFTITEVN